MSKIVYHNKMYNYITQNDIEKMIYLSKSFQMISKKGSVKKTKYTDNVGNIMIAEYTYDQINDIRDFITLEFINYDSDEINGHVKMILSKINDNHSKFDGNYTLKLDTYDDIVNFDNFCLSIEERILHITEEYK